MTALPPYSMRGWKALIVVLVLFCMLKIDTASAVAIKSTHEIGNYFPLGRLFMDSATEVGKSIGRIKAFVTISSSDPKFVPQEKMELLIYIGKKASWGVARNAENCEVRHDLAVQTLDIELVPNKDENDDNQVSLEDIDTSGSRNTKASVSSNPVSTYREYHYTLNSQNVLSALPNWRGFYFFALTSPLCEFMSDISYNVRVTRIDSAWSKEFGLNQTGLNTLYTVFFPLYILLLALHFYSVRRLTTTRPIVHPALKAFTMTLFIEFLSLVGHLIHYLQYTTNGLGAWTLNCASAIVDVIARTTFLFVLIAVANGWGVTNLEIKHIRKVWAVVAVFCGLSIGHSIFEFASNTPLDLGPPDGAAEFETTIAVLGLLLSVWFILSAVRTMKFTNDEKKRNFLLVIAAIYGLYFVSIPTVALLSANLTPQLRSKAPIMFTHVVTYMGFAGMVSRFWYTRSPKIFLFDNQQLVESEPDFQRL